MDMTTNVGGELSVSNYQGSTKFGDIDNGTYEAIYKSFKPFHDLTTPWGGEEKGVRLMFEITKGPFAKKMISFKGKMFQNDDSGQWVIGSKSKLADAIRNITGGTETLNKGHEGTRLFIEVKNGVGKPGSKNPGKLYPNVHAIIPFPKDYAAATPAPVTQPAKVQTQAPVVTAPVTQTQVTQPQTTQKPNENLMNDLNDLSDFDKL